MYQASRGTNDILPEDWPYWRYLLSNIDRLASLYGFRQIEPPIFEVTDLFERGAGEGADLVVQKEMYTFEDKGGTSLTLRPEFTAGVMRAYLEHGMKVLPSPVKLYSVGPIFRQERPQAGRYRQHTQWNIEVLGEIDPAVDFEVMSIAWQLFEAIGFQGLEFQLNSIGCPVCRPAHIDALVAYFSQYETTLSDVDKRRLAVNPLRLLDSKEKSAQPLLASAPRSIDFLCDECRDHFDTLLVYLDEADLPYTVNDRLVRGFDYYTKTVFEVWAEGIGAQAAVCGGGRYDGLIELLGGPSTPGIGFGSGIERQILALKAQGITPPPLDAPVVQVSYIGKGDVGRRTKNAAVGLVRELRQLGIGALLPFGDRSLKSQLKSANRAGVAFVVIVGEDELESGQATVRNLSDGNQQSIALTAVASWLTQQLA
ncbi:MAG: histidine--tRNA ligase [Chloroflexota bacterium]|nr:histidine--tRNA ligase [Chloroflexota bacterium]